MVVVVVFSSSSGIEEEEISEEEKNLASLFEERGERKELFSFLPPNSKEERGN